MDRELPAWAIGRFVLLGEPESGSCPADSMTVTVESDGAFEYTLSGSGVVGFAEGAVEPTGDPDVVAFVSEHEPFPGLSGAVGSRWEATRTGIPYRGSVRIDLSPASTDETYVMVAAPDGSPGVFPDELIGLHAGETSRIDFLEPETGTILRSGDPRPADGSDGPRLSLEIGSGGEVAYVEALEDGVHTFVRAGYVEGWEGEAGVVRFTDSYGICMSDSGRGSLRRPTHDRIALEITRTVQDVGDADGDGDVTDPVVVRETLVVVLE